MAGVSCLAFFFDVSAAFESIGTDRVPIFDRPVSGRETLSQLVFVLALHFVQHLPPSLPFSVLALSLLRISIIPDPTGSPWMPMTVRGCVPLCMYLDNEKCVYGILLRRISCFRVDRHGSRVVLRDQQARSSIARRGAAALARTLAAAGAAAAGEPGEAGAGRGRAAAGAGVPKSEQCRSASSEPRSILGAGASSALPDGEPEDEEEEPSARPHRAHGGTGATTTPASGEKRSEAGW